MLERAQKQECMQRMHCVESRIQIQSEKSMGEQKTNIQQPLQLPRKWIGVKCKNKNNAIMWLMKSVFMHCTSYYPCNFMCGKWSKDRISQGQLYTHAVNCVYSNLFSAALRIVLIFTKMTSFSLFSCRIYCVQYNYEDRNKEGKQKTTTF